MAKNRARDPKRVPSLGISEPISHVKTQPQSARRDMSDTETDLGMKVDAFGNPNIDRRNDSYNKQYHANYVTNKSRSEGTLPVIKINSGN